MRRTTLAAVLTIVACTSAQAAEADAKKSVLMLSHWQCSTWASMHDDTASVERHFTAGLDAGKVFLDAVVAGTITQEESFQTVPWIVGLSMQGPSPDFILGRLFESIQTDAYGRITKTGADGLPLGPADYITDDALVSTLSQTQYNRSNCGLL